MQIVANREDELMQQYIFAPWASAALPVDAAVWVIESRAYLSLGCSLYHPANSYLMISGGFSALKLSTVYCEKQ